MAEPPVQSPKYFMQWINLTYSANLLPHPIPYQNETKQVIPVFLACVKYAVDDWSKIQHTRIKK